MKPSSWGRIPLAAKLPMMLGSVLLLTMGASTLGGYYVVRRVTLDAADERLGGVVKQVTASLEASLHRPTPALQIADFPATREFLRTGAGRERVLDTLRTWVNRAPKGSNPTVELWTAGGDRVMSVGSGAAAQPVNDVRKLTDALTPTSRLAVGPFRRDKKGVLSQAATAVVDGGKVTGWIVDNRWVAMNQAGAQLLSGLIGSEARFLLGNASGDVFTDLGSPVEGPPARVDWTKGIATYTPTGHAEVMARGLALPGTPWVVVVELPRALVLTTANRFLLTMSVLSVVFVLAGVVVGWGVTRRITTPLHAVTEAAERIAAGESAPRLSIARQDEVGRLATSFATMAQRVDEAKRNLERLVYRYRLLFEENPLPMWVYDRETRSFVDVNDAAVRRYGFTRSEFLSMPPTQLRNGNGSDGWPVDAALPSGAHNGHRAHRHRLKSGAHIDVELTRHDVDLEGRPVALIAANDVTARLAAERSLREREEELRRLNVELERRVVERTSELEQANKELEAFSYSVSHDLRAPLRAIAGFSRILLDDHKDELSETVRGPVEVVERNAKQMGQLLDDLLTFSRYSRKALSRADVNMTTLANAAADEARRGEDPARALDLVIHPLPPALGEPSMLRQVLVNLLSNALKFTRGRTPARIEVGHCPDQAPPTYFVRDNGVGFDMKYAARLFGVFERLHRQEDYEGTGVGLAIVDRIVRRHGGRVWAESALNSGTTFFFTLEAPEGQLA